MDKEYLQRIINESLNRKEVLEKLNIAASSYNYQKLQRILDNYNIDYSKLLGSGSRRKRNINDILIEDSNFKNSHLKDRLIKENLKENKCEICGINEWNGKPISLQLHHINGNPQDNRIENLQLLCPNCHSQTENFGGKNIKIEKEIHYCCICGKELKTKDSHLCVDCASKKNRKTERPSKEELLNLIKNTPFTKIGEMFGVSDNAVRKWCKQEGLSFLKKDIKFLK